MSNAPANRPSTTRKRTPKDEAVREAKHDQDFSIRVDDTCYTLVPSDINGLVEMKVRRETAKVFGGSGFSINEIISSCGSSSVGMDLISCFMYAAETAAGRDADLEQIMSSISWDSDFEVGDGKGEPVPQP